MIRIGPFSPLRSNDLTLQARLAGTKHRLPASYVLWWWLAYSGNIGTAIRLRRRGTLSLAGGHIREM